MCTDITQCMIGMEWIVFIFILHSVSAQYLSYGCYSETLNVSCSTGQIHPLSVSVGTNVSSQDCPRTYLEGLSNIKTLKGPYHDDICEKELSPEQSYKYHENCIGRTHCSPNTTDRMETLMKCSENMLSNYTTFMELEYECIANAQIVTLENDRRVNHTSDPNGPLYIQGKSYVKEEINNDTESFPLSCSIRSTSNASMINIEVFDLRLSTNNGVCTQSIILDDGNKFINVTCNNNTDFIKFYPFETDTSCLSLTLSNSSHDGYFWFKFTAIGSVSIECPPISCSTITAPTLTTEATTKGSTTTTSRTTTDDQQIYTLTTESTTMTTESTTMTTESTTRESTTRESTTSKTSSTDDQLIYIPLGVVLFLIVLCVVLVLCNKNKCMLWRKSRIYPLTDLGIEYRPRAEIPDAEENMSYYNIYNH